MKVKLHVVRHGQTDYNSEHRINGHFNSQLTLAGVEGSKTCGEYLKSVNFDQVLVSDLGRAIETLQCFGLDGELELRLRDRNFGPYNGQLYANYVKAKHEEKERLCDGPQDVKQYLIPSATSSCVLTSADLINGHASRHANGHANGHTNGHANKRTKGHVSELLENEYHTKMLTEIEPAGVERYDQMFTRIEDLIHDTMYKTSVRCAGRKKAANVLFVTHCGPVRMCAMMLSAYSPAKFPSDLRKCYIPNNSVSEFCITVNDKNHGIESVQLVKLASDKHLHIM